MEKSNFALLMLSVARLPQTPLPQRLGATTQAALRISLIVFALARSQISLTMFILSTRLLTVGRPSLLLQLAGVGIAQLLRLMLSLSGIMQ